MPGKKTVILEKYREFMNEIILNPTDKVLMEQLPLKLKWNLIQRHNLEK